MKIYLHIGMEQCGSERLQQVLEAKRGQLAGKGVLYPRAGGGRSHTRLYMAVSDPGSPDILRFNRGLASPAQQASLRQSLIGDLASELAKSQAQTLILSAAQLCTLPTTSALKRLRALLLPLSDDIRIIAHVDEQARLLARHYAAAILSGRTAPLDQELALASAGGWRENALKDWQEYAPVQHGFPEVQAAPFWLDYHGLQQHWEGVFGSQSVSFRPYDAARFAGEGIVDEILEAFDIKDNIGKVEASSQLGQPAATNLARMRAVNLLFVALLGKGRVIPRQLWRRLLDEVAITGAPLKPGSLGAISKHFAKDNKALIKAHTALQTSHLKRDAKEKNWLEADPQFGFRASQYVAAFLPRIDKATREENSKAKAATTPDDSASLSPTAEKLLSPRARENYDHLKGGRFEPHNNVGRLNEAEEAAPYTEVSRRILPKGNSGKVIVGCMKDEAPYILEWVAYHRAIGVDNFIIYTNACSDGTSELLDLLQELGVLQHRNNDNWKGNSPQQYALNQSLKEDVIKNAEWLIHIDVDEFINVRVGNGTLDDFLARVPDASNVAMTWRLFGHNDVTRLSDDLVLEQFDMAAPKHCPKPHTVWGFKTMVRNIGAYEKLSCHRPNKLRQGQADKVSWVNGSGLPMGEDIKEKGWRSSLNNIGYEMLQLNHYALRSAESFLIKRQRGRALHVDRSIGLNYWVRMDWSDHKDVTIKRNIPRLRAELERLREDAALVALHEAGLEWHRAKVAELHENPEFQELYAQALATKISPLERVAHALALDVES